MSTISGSAYSVHADSPSTIKGLLKKIEEIPSLPSAALQALELIMMDDVDVNRLAMVIESDLAMTLKILKLVNAASHSLLQEVKSIRQSINLLGLNTIRLSVLGVLVRDFFPDSKEQTHFDEIWAHSLACAVAAQLIAEKTYPELKYEVFTLGMLHDIGKIFIIEFLPEDYERIRTYQALHKCSMIMAEQEILGTNHTQIGKWIGEKWNLPERIIRGIWLHHNPPDTLEVIREDHEILSVIMLANIVAHEHFSDVFNRGYWMDKKRLMERLAITPDELQEVLGMLSVRYAERARLFALEDDLNRIYFQSLSKANQKLSSMALEMDDQNRILTKINKIAKINSELALTISTAQTFHDILFELARIYMRSEMFNIGVVYVIDLEQRLLEGIVWSRKRIKKFLCFLHKDGAPIWDQQTQKVPPGLKEIMSSYGERLKGYLPGDTTTSNFICFKPPFCLVPVYSDRSIHGELCLSLSQGITGISEEEKLGLLHSANLTAAGIKKIQLVDKLENRSEELNLALWKNQQINLKLLQTERLAAVGQLAAGAAHEINNPLAIINARAQLLQRREKDEKKHRELKQITEQIDRISGILTDLMTFARPSPPKLVLVDITALLDKILELVENGLEKYGISIVRKYAQSLPLIKADQNQLEQVFLNLIINAQHAMENIGGELTVSTSLSADGQTLIIAIADQGSGISKKHLSQIFDPFFTTKEEGKGTGLGLSTSRVIVENHYGQMDIDSQENVGTTVTIRIPVDLESLKKANRSAGQPAAPSSPFGNPRILVVDDEEHIREILQETLEAENMTVETVRNGEEALTLLENESFDLMLLDIRMPRRNGLSLLSAIHEMDRSIPVIIISAMATPEEMQEAVELGATKCIRKPFHIKSLLKDIHDVLNPKH
ncbi:MAG: HDOD domain-containing protein [Desulfovibrionales bacterium]